MAWLGATRSERDSARGWVGVCTRAISAVRGARPPRCCCHSDRMCIGPWYEAMRGAGTVCVRRRLRAPACLPLERPGVRSECSRPHHSESLLRSSRAPYLAAAPAPERTWHKTDTSVTYTYYGLDLSPAEAGARRVAGTSRALGIASSVRLAELRQSSANSAAAGKRDGQGPR